MRRRGITRRAVGGGLVASYATLATRQTSAKFQQFHGGGAPSGGLSLTIDPSQIDPISMRGVIRPLGQIIGNSLYYQDYPGPVSGTSGYAGAGVKATIANGPRNALDYLTFVQTSNPTVQVTSPYYLNGSFTPPGSGFTNATVNVPSVPGGVWNANYLTGTTPVVPVTTDWTLQFRSGLGGNPVLASVPITINVLQRSNPYFQSIGEIAQGFLMKILNPRITSQGGSTGGGLCPVCSGTMTVQLLIAYSPPPATANTATIQYHIDDIPVGPYVVGPSTGGVFQSWTLNIDTTNVAWNGRTGIPDGTHSLAVRLVDYTAGSNATHDLPYYWQTLQQPFIVNNAGGSLATFYNSPRTIPMMDPGYGGGSPRPGSSRVDFLTFPGFSSIGTAHNTIVPIPSPQGGFIPPATADPRYNTPTTAALLRDWSLFYVEALSGVISGEYQFYPRFFINDAGGVYAYGGSAEASQSIESAYGNYIAHCNFDGQRGDNQTDPYSSAIDGWDGTFWLVAEAFGRVIKLDHTGAVTTLAGTTTNRAKLGFNGGTPPDPGATEANIDASGCLTQIGTIGTPAIGNMRGINDLCYDPRTAVGAVNNTVFVASPIDHKIIKIVWPGPGLHQGSPTITRYAGQDGGLGNAATIRGSNGGFVDGPATEYIAGTTVATLHSTIDSSGVLTVVSLDSGTLSAGCPLSWSGNPNTTTGNLITAHLTGGAGTGSTWQTNVTTPVSTSTPMTASQPVALFAGPYSAQIADGTGIDPAGTMYVADYQNWAIRKISPAGMVSTLFGNQANRPTFDSNLNPTGPLDAAPPVNISSMTWAANIATVTMSAPVQLFGTNIAPYWTVTLANVTNSGSAGAAAVNGQFQVLSAAPGGQSFTLKMTPSSGTIVSPLGVTGPPVATVTADYQDLWVPCAPGTTPLSTAYCAFPQRIVWNSTKKLILGSAWYVSAQEIDLSASTIKYVGTFGASGPNNRVNAGGRTRGIAWFQIDVDSAGTTGPADDVYMFYTPGDENFITMCAADGSVPTIDGIPYPGFTGKQKFDPLVPLPMGGIGIGHYPWTIAISRHQGRRLTSGISDAGLYGSRIKNTYDISQDASQTPGLNVDTAALNRGFNNYLQGSVQNNDKASIPGIFPWGVRPGFSMLHGDLGQSQCWLRNTGLGQANTDTFDGLMQNFPTDAALGAFIQSGFGGAIPRPEWTGDDLADLIYWIRRSSMLGSFNLPLVQRAAYQLDVVAPVISAVVATRASTTSITVTWNTDKPTYGCAAAGFASAHGTPFPYHIFAFEAYGGNSDINLSYRTSHSVTLIGLQVSVTTYVIVVSKDMPGNAAISAEVTVA